MKIQNHIVGDVINCSPCHRYDPSFSWVTFVLFFCLPAALMCGSWAGYELVIARDLKVLCSIFLQRRLIAEWKNAWAASNGLVTPGGQQVGDVQNGSSKAAAIFRSCFWQAGRREGGATAYTSLNVNEEKGKDKNSRCALPPNVECRMGYCWKDGGLRISVHTGFYNIYSIYSGVVVRARNSSPTKTTL